MRSRITEKGFLGDLSHYGMECGGLRAVRPLAVYFKYKSAFAFPKLEDVC